MPQPGSTLHIETDALEAELTRRNLREAGMGDVLHTCCSVKEALSYLAVATPSLIIMDLELPDANGMDGLASIVAVAPCVPVVVTSRRDDEKLVSLALERGAQDYLIKGQYSVALLSRVCRYAIARKRAESIVLQSARFDPVTGLVNRSYFVSLFEQALQRSDSIGELAVMFIDLDHFKMVNDTFGHQAGDELLRLVSARLTRCIGRDDVLSRFGGDEFTVLLHPTTGSPLAVEIAQAMIASLSVPFCLSGVRVTISPSIGIATGSLGGRNADDLLRHADIAMYRAKQGGRNRFAFFDEEMSVQQMATCQLESELKQAVAQGDFFYHFQPIWDARTRRVTAIEALLRWRRPSTGEVLKAEEFVGVLERSGMLYRVVEQALPQAFSVAREAQQRFSDAPVRLCINVSPLELARESFIRSLIVAKETFGLADGGIEIEVTEHTLLENTAHNLKMLALLRDKGICIAIDDFGSGFSSLGYLSEFRVDTVKVDRSLLRTVPESRDSSLVLAGVLGIANALKLRVVVEGVETLEQLRWLLDEGCNEMQGYMLSCAVDKEELMHRIVTLSSSLVEQAIPPAKVVRLKG